MARCRPAIIEVIAMQRIHAATAAAVLLVAGLGLAQAADMTFVLTGAQEVPPVTTDAKGTAAISVGADKSVRGHVTTTGISGIAAHIHLAEAGRNGPPIIVLVKSSDTEWTVTAGASLTDEQYEAYKAGKLYVNVHSDAHKGGEIRAQLKP
jgi:hypothetical protein